MHVSQLKDLLDCAFRFKLYHLDQERTHLPLARIEDLAHKQALKAVLREGLDHKQHESLLKALIREKLPTARRSTRTLAQAMAHAELSVGIFHSTVLKSQMPPRPWVLDVDYKIAVGDTTVEATIDLLAGKKPIIFQNHFVSQANRRSIMSSDFEVGMALNYDKSQFVDCVLFSLVGHRCHYLEGSLRSIRKRSLRVAKDALNQIKSGAFPRCDPGKFCCTQAWCEFYHECGKKR